MDAMPGRRPRLGDQLYGRILEGILSGTYREGEKLPSESRICQAFGVSRPTVREALMRLHADGLVATRQGSGTVVQKRPPDGIARLAPASDIPGILRCLEVRIPLEARAAALAAERRSAAEMERIARALDGLRTSLEAGTVPVEADHAFHRAVAAASGNALFAEMLAALEGAIHQSMTVALGLTHAGSKERARRVAEEHEAVAEAVRRGDPEAAELAMRYHLHRTRQRVTDGAREL